MTLKLKFLKIIKKRSVVLSDCAHVIGIGMMKDLKKDLIKQHYGEISFNFGYLEQAHSYFEGIIGRGFDSNYIRCLIPREKNGPIIFLYDGVILGNKKTKTFFFAIAPRYEEDEVNSVE